MAALKHRKRIKKLKEKRGAQRLAQQSKLAEDS